MTDAPSPSSTTPQASPAPEVPPGHRPDKEPTLTPAASAETGAEPLGAEPLGAEPLGAEPLDSEPLGADPAPTPVVPAPVGPGSRVKAPSPAALAGRLQSAPHRTAAAFGRVAQDGTVFVRAPEGEREVGSYPGASPIEALAYFARKFAEVDAQADLLLHRVTQTDLSVKDAIDALNRLRETTANLRAVGDLAALAAKIETIATAVQARRTLESAERAAAREAAKAHREQIVAAAESLAGQPEDRIQWKTSSSRMRELLDEWKGTQRSGPKLDRDTEQGLWQRLSAARNSFDKLRRVHFAQLGSVQAVAKATKEELAVEAEVLATSTDWGPTASAFKRLMDRWRQAGRASRGDDDALWQRFKAAQDAFFAAKDAVVAAENEEFIGNLAVKEELMKQAESLLPIKDLETTKATLRSIQDKWDAAGKVPRADVERLEKGMRRVESAVREADERRWAATSPEVAARAESLVTQLETAVAGLRTDLATAEANGNSRKVAAAREALQAREAWLEQARAGLAEFRG
ncbi:MAG TPA: DUF349 domain-containing protein [Dermatophilaceae bacterium]|nr:DUF349 domain-containing protein [Dermatophilaceae bacterium]